MAELRWLLLLIGIGVIAAIYIYTRYQPGITERMRGLQFRREPRISDAVVDAEQSSSEASMQDRDPVRTPPSLSPAPRKVVTIRLMSRDTAGFFAERMILLLRELKLRHGQFGIFHRCDESAGEDADAVFSVASLVEPGSFDLTQVKTERYPGVSLFMTLPGPCDGVTAFDDMMDLARELGERLDGYLLDEQGGTLSIQRERYIREEIIQFEHRESV